MKTIIFYIISLLSFINILNCQEIVLKPYFAVNLHTDNNANLKVKGYHDKYGNLYVNVEKENGIIISSIFLFHSDLSSNEIIKKCKLDSDSIDEYVILTCDYYSNYGASNYIVIWYNGDNVYDNYNWRLSQVGDYSQPELKDVNNDGIYEFIEHYQSHNKQGDIYSFYKGHLIPFNKIK
jgi:hypothetical protein